MLDPKDKRDWQREAIAARTKYVRIIRREIKGRVRWFCQLVQEGLPPATHTTKDGTVGLDIGPSSIAAVSSDDAILEQLCPSVVEPWNDCRRIQRAMDRSRRATNLDNFDAKGRAIKGKRRWNRSQRYQALAASKRERDRVLAAERKRSHGELANRILGAKRRSSAISCHSISCSPRVRPDLDAVADDHARATRSGMPRDDSCPDAAKPHSSIKVFSIAEPSIAWPALAEIVQRLPASCFNPGATRQALSYRFSN